jgi:UDP-2-acetamido-3-amino-2,3-dideoxy-glucuronate N-acetyltransferase
MPSEGQAGSNRVGGNSSCRAQRGRPFPTERHFQLRNVEWGTGCIVYQPCNIYKCSIGNNVKIGPFTEIQEFCNIGDGTVVGSHSFIAAGTRIGRNVFLGHGVITCNDRHPRANNKDWCCFPPSIGDGASIGSGAIILPGIQVGKNAVVGAGVTVVVDVPANSTYVGKPAPAARRLAKSSSGTKNL